MRRDGTAAVVWCHCRVLRLISTGLVQMKLTLLNQNSAIRQLDLEVPAKTEIVKSARSLTYLEQQRAEDAAAVAAGDPDDDRVAP